MTVIGCCCRSYETLQRNVGGPCCVCCCFGACFCLGCAGGLRGCGGAAGAGVGAGGGGSAVTTGLLQSVSQMSEIGGSTACRPRLAAHTQPVKMRRTSPCSVTSSTSMKESVFWASVEGRE